MEHSFTSVNNDAAIAEDLKHLSLETAIEDSLPPSSWGHVDARTAHIAGLAASPTSARTPKPLRRTPSTGSLNHERTTTPTLQKRTSLSSIKSLGSTTPPRSPAVRRTSSNLNALALQPEEPMPPPVTTASVACDWFKEELQAYHEGEGKSQETMVLLQDDCYGHRYSRPRTSRAGLATIVERPERVHASILGIAAAYVRQGGHHAEGINAPSPRPNARSSSSMPFRIHKTAKRLPLTSTAVTQVHGLHWMKELISMCEGAEKKLALGQKELVRPLPEDAVAAQSRGDMPKLHEGDLYLCAESLDALEGALGAVCEGVDSVMSDNSTKRAFVCIRPPGHHCSSDYPSGFCWLNNVHVGISHAAQHQGLTHAAIIDFDLHHGDGSQSITWAHNARIASLSKNTPMSKKTAIGYFSLHDINSYPCESGDEDKVRNASLCIENAHGQNIWNVHLQPWSTSVEFWRLYGERYIVLLDKARNFLRSHSDRLRASSISPPPKAVIFLSAGFDASEWESSHMQRHKVNVPTDFYARFTRDVIRLAEEEGLGVNGRVISVLEGGYSDRALMSGVLSHLTGLIPPRPRPSSSGSSSGLGQEMGRRLGRFNVDSPLKKENVEPEPLVDKDLNSDWWAVSQLEAFEKLVNPSSQPAPPARARNALPPTFISQTQSSAAKIVSPPAARRSLSGSFQSSQTTLPPLPEAPPPPVDWATAAHELASLLIPTHRQTQSCKPEELNAEASRIRRDRHSAVGLAATPEEPSVIDTKRMQLRDRKFKSPKYTSKEEEEKPALLRTNRRKTIDPSMLGQGAVEAVATKPAVKASRRRLSVASSVGSVAGDRPSTADSIPSSTASVPPPAPVAGHSLPVRKTRSPSKPRANAPPPKPRATKKAAPPVPRVPSDSSRPAGSTAAASGVLDPPLAANVNGVPAPLTENDEKRNQDVEGLASGMKKMTIKFGVPKKEGSTVAKESSDKDLAMKKKPVARGRPPKGSATSLTGYAFSASKKTVNAKEASSKAAEEGLADKIAPGGRNKAAGLGMDTDATKVRNNNGERLVPTHGLPMAVEISALDHPQDEHNCDSEERIGKEVTKGSPRVNWPIEANIDEARSQPNGAGILPLTAANPGSSADVAVSEPFPKPEQAKPSTFVPPENPTIQVEAHVDAVEQLFKFGADLPRTSIANRNENIDPVLFYTAPSSQTTDPALASSRPLEDAQQPMIHPSPPRVAPHHFQEPLHYTDATPSSPPIIASPPLTSKPQQNRANLPVFTANSPIPFGNSSSYHHQPVVSTPSSHQLQQEAARVSAGPSPAPPLPRQQAPQTWQRDKRLDVEPFIEPTGTGNGTVDKEQDAALWEIPETPQPTTIGRKR